MPPDRRSSSAAGKRQMREHGKRERKLLLLYSLTRQAVRQKERAQESGAVARREIPKTSAPEDEAEKESTKEQER